MEILKDMYVQSYTASHTVRYEIRNETGGGEGIGVSLCYLSYIRGCPCGPNLANAVSRCQAQRIGTRFSVARIEKDAALIEAAE